MLQALQGTQLFGVQVDRTLIEKLYQLFYYIIGNLQLVLTTALQTQVKYS